MKRKKFKLKYIVLIVIFFGFLFSCTKEIQEPSYSYFISKEFSVSYTKSYIEGMIDLVSTFTPEIADLKPLIKSDIKVYKIVYKTTIDGRQVNASGLVCIPATPGEYPVLSFQNGTHTQYSTAPSENASDNSYQFVEIIASIGYIVVFADYPGFGESTEVPHPYLITEPTVRSLVDMLYAVKELTVSEIPDITLINEYYLLGYSQGGWATLALHKALELEYSSDFNLIGSTCGAGPYNISLLLQEMVNTTSYPMPVYLAYILNAYKAYNQFTNPVSDIFNEPYATRLSSLFTGSLSLGQINSQLTTSISGLINPEFLSGFLTSSKYSGVRDALNNNSIKAWHTYKPLLLTHGTLDIDVNPISTENIYSAFMEEGTSPDICKKILIPDADHGDGIFPCMISGIRFLNDLNHSD